MLLRVALTESVSSDAVGGAAERAVDARQRKLCSPAFLLFRKGWGFWGDPPRTISGGQRCRRKAPAFAANRKGWATGLVSSAHAESQRLGYINNAAPNYNWRAVTRLRRIADHDRIFFITARLGRGVGPLSSTERHIVLEYVFAERAAHTFLLFGYVVMPDHLHLLMAPLHSGLQDGMHRLKMKTGRRIRSERGQHGPFWQARYFDFVLRRVGDFWEKLQYIHQNPVKAGLVVLPEEWPWSSAAHYAKKSAIEMIDEIDLPPDRSALVWPAPWR